MSDPTGDPNKKVQTVNPDETSTNDDPREDQHATPPYDPPKGAEQADRADAQADGTSSLHYGANDPATWEDQKRDEG